MKIKELAYLLAYLSSAYGEDVGVAVDGDGGDDLALLGGFRVERDDKGKVVGVILQ